MDKWKFGIDNDLLVSLVISGKKTATSSLYVGDIPDINDKSIILWDDNTEACMIKITNTQIIKFKDFTLDIILKEGEDTSLKEWREKHIAFFNNETENFNEESLILFEEFKCIKTYKKD